MWGHRCFAVFMVWLVFLPGCGFSGEAEGGEAQIRQWIGELSADEYRVRETAREKLLEAGEEARAHLEKAVEDPNPQTAAAAERILETLDTLPYRLRSLGREGIREELLGTDRFRVVEDGEVVGNLERRVEAGKEEGEPVYRFRLSGEIRKEKVEWEGLFNSRFSPIRFDMTVPEGKVKLRREKREWVLTPPKGEPHTIAAREEDLLYPALFWLFPYWILEENHTYRIRAIRLDQWRLGGRWEELEITREPETETWMWGGKKKGVEMGVTDPYGFRSSVWFRAPAQVLQIKAVPYQYYPMSETEGDR